MMPEVMRQQTVHTGRAFTVRHDQVRLPDGTLTGYDVVVHAGAVTLVPIDHDGKVWLVRQYRHSAGGVLLEFPAGTLEAGEPPEACAARECREEVGLAPGELSLLGECFLAPGYSTEYMYFYLARRLTPAPLPGDADEALDALAVDPADLPSLVASGELRDAKSLAALWLARSQLGLTG